MGRGKRPTANQTSARPRLHPSGKRSWWRDGELHRDDGPAVEWPDGKRAWWRDGELHRDDGPAIERPDGRREWYRDDKLHRDDGPAVELANGGGEWWLNGQQVDEATGREHMRATQLAAVAVTPSGPRSRVSALAE